MGVFPDAGGAALLGRSGRGGRTMSVLVWLLTGWVIARACARSARYEFPSGRTACVVGGTAGGFLGGGFYEVATSATGVLLYAPSAAAAAVGALVVIGAIGWAGNDGRGAMGAGAGSDRRNRARE